MTNTNSIHSNVRSIAYKEEIQAYDAFVLFILRDLLELEEGVYTEAMQAGGSRDCGIDAFWVEDETVHILQAKFYNPKNKVSEKEIDNFSNVLLYLNDPTKVPKKRCKKFIKEKSIEYKECMEKKYSTHLLFVTSSSLQNAAVDKSKLIQDKYSGADIEFEVWNIDDICQKYLENFKPQKPNICLEVREHYKSKGIKGSNAPYIVATISAIDLFSAYKKYKGSIFAKNLRFYMPGGSINKGILETLNDAKTRNNFWYYNNGITIICDKYKVIKDEKEKGKQVAIEIENAQIVNGAQTTRSIYEALLNIDPKDAKNILIMGRIIKTENDEDFIDKIREFNNKQNPTKPRDFASHLKEQVRLQRDFQIRKYFYEIKRGERYEAIESLTIRSKRLTVIDNLTVAQAQYSFIGYPSEAKAKTAMLLDVSSDHYKNIFINNISADELLLSYLCYKKAKDKYKLFKKKMKGKEINEKEGYMIHGTNHIVAIMGQVAEEIIGYKSFLVSPQKLNLIINDAYLDKIYDVSHDILEEIYANKIDFYVAEKVSLAPAKYFKSLKDSNLLLELSLKMVKRKEKELRKELKIGEK